MRENKLNNDEIFSVISSALSFVDPRLMDHGERVAYIAQRIAEKLPNGEKIDKKVLFVLCLLHDIGAYKTEEIDHLVSFETDSVFRHSLYGYLFLKYMTPLSRYAKAVLYHHEPYKKIAGRPMSLYASLIHLADRADIFFLSTNHTSLGGVFFTAHSGNSFKKELVDAFIEANIDGSISSALHTSSYKEQLKEMLKDLRFTDKEVATYLKMLVFTIEFRSPYTLTHTADASVIATELARRMGIGPAELELISYGALLHDIGKIAIPTEILEKPTGLDEQEIARMRTHVEYTARIINNIVPEKVYRLAVRHHEKLNGSGYPEGIKADDLTLPERIVAVADIISALIGQRSYKGAFETDRVKQILRQEVAKGELDGEVCEVFFKDSAKILRKTARKRKPLLKTYKRINKTFEKQLKRILRTTNENSG